MLPPAHIPAARTVAVYAAVCLAGMLGVGRVAAQLTGTLGAHDPSTVIYDDGRYYYFATGDRLAVRSSSNLSSWTGEPAAFDAVPSWVAGAVPGYSGQSLWAPDVIKLGDQFALYYSASVWGTKLSAIGYATSPTLDPDAPDYGWTDHGMIISSNHGSPYNAIDPSLMLDESTGKLWMTWGSFNNGIYVKEMNPTTGAPLNSSPGVNVAAPSPTPEIEGAAMLQHNGDYYLFTNWGGCCSGVDSTYNIRVGRSTSPTGPFLDRDGVNMLNDGGTLFFDDDGRKVGPGHFSLTNVGGREQFSYHYYDANAVGAPTFGLRDLYWSDDGWPMLAEVDSRWGASLAGDWSDPANWTGAGVPDGLGHIATFDGPGSGRTLYQLALGAVGRTVGTLNFRSPARYQIGEAGGPTLTLNDTAGETATLNATEGYHTILAPVNAVDALEVNSGANAAITLGGPLTAPSLDKYGFGELYLGGTSNIAGSVFVRRGVLGVTGAVTANSFCSVGATVGENAQLTVSGTGSFTANGDLNIGDTGDANTPATGTLTITDQASVTVTASGGFYVGSGFFANTRAEGAVVQSGGTLTVTRSTDGSFVVGGRTSNQANGSYTLTGGVVAANTNVAIGNRGAGVFEQHGGQFNAAGHISIARYSGSTGSWTLSGGSLLQTSGRRAIYVGEQGQGVLTLDADAEVHTNSAVTLGLQAGSEGDLVLDGGLLAAPGISRGSGVGNLWLNGGLLQATTTNVLFLTGLTSAQVQAGGARFDTQAHAITVGQTLTHHAGLGATADGGLQKLGDGKLTLTAANAFTGPTVIEAGTLLASNTSGSATGLAGVVVNAGGVLGGNGSAAGQTTVHSGGVIAPGDAIGRLTVDSLAMNPGAALAIELDTAGGVPGTDYDQLLVNGLATLNGALAVALTGTSTPAAGDSFTVLTAGSLSGEFAGVANGGFVALADNRGALRVRYDLVPNAVVLTDYQAAPFLAGDYNGDGQVDAADYVVWRDNLGAPAGTLINDPSLAAIGPDQRATWAVNYGATLTAAAAAAVPTPQAAWLLFTVLAAVGWRHARRLG
ncbi:Intracellular endo-alpha-(1-_5)-L-arabinanase [Posidoniimonas polymericola]|uniref:Intracellular endo-alpha-(1->5)-L-arabinanase n=1 Tax=Posidoniimonas polymericola TaxID=2528002 RepID=A0A5C5YSM5_9BACT|nr:arabinan endo-1,5-alpha-L-arabinosidase [Posidoniimonas polymericola]TWT77876.1 Intracellular endo-alpha-(1->5)-L-arabinanase [Posidoniimonas polymericola]